MQRQLLLALKRFHTYLRKQSAIYIYYSQERTYIIANITYITHMWPIRNVRQLVARQMVLALQSRIANIANESSFDGMRNDVLFDQTSIRICHLAFGAAVQRRSVQGFRLANLAGLRAGFLFLRCGFLFPYQANTI